MRTLAPILLSLRLNYRTCLMKTAFGNRSTRRVLVVVVVGALAACSSGDGLKTCEDEEIGPGDCKACGQDNPCGNGETCAADESCWPPSDLDQITVTWTVDGQPASAATCASIPNLEIILSVGGLYVNDIDSLGYGPVPCALGTLAESDIPQALLANVYITTDPLPSSGQLLGKVTSATGPTIVVDLTP